MLKLVSNISQNRTSTRSNISFGKVPSRETMQYLSGLKPYERNIGSIDLSKIEDVFEGINIFKGIKVKDIFKNQKHFSFNTILIQRGCPHQCVHCGAESQEKIQKMPWDNFTKIIDGIGTLRERLGFNPFKMIVENENEIELYKDTDIILYSSAGKDGQIHNSYDAAKYMHEKIGAKTIVQTAGLTSPIAQKAAEQFVEDSSILRAFGLSVHPFHGRMEKSIQAAMAGNENEAEKHRNIYTDIMANAIRTTMGLKNKLVVIQEYVSCHAKLFDERKWKYYSEDSVTELYKEICKKANIAPNEIAIQDRKIIFLGKASNLGSNYDDIEKLKIDPSSKEPYNTMMIDVDGSILSNPFRERTFHCQPKPFFGSDGQPLKLNLD